MVGDAEAMVLSAPNVLRFVSWSERVESSGVRCCTSLLASVHFVSYFARNEDTRLEQEGDEREKDREGEGRVECGERGGRRSMEHTHKVNQYHTLRSKPISIGVNLEIGRV